MVWYPSRTSHVTMRRQELCRLTKWGYLQTTSTISRKLSVQNKRTGLASHPTEMSSPPIGRDMRSIMGQQTILRSVPLGSVIEHAGADLWLL